MNASIVYTLTDDDDDVEIQLETEGNAGNYFCHYRLIVTHFLLNFLAVKIHAMLCWFPWIFLFYNTIFKNYFIYFYFFNFTDHFSNVNNFFIITAKCKKWLKKMVSQCQATKITVNCIKLITTTALQLLLLLFWLFTCSFGCLFIPVVVV